MAHFGNPKKVVRLSYDDFVELAGIDRMVLWEFPALAAPPSPVPSPPPSPPPHGAADQLAPLATEARQRVGVPVRARAASMDKCALRCRAFAAAIVARLCQQGLLQEEALFVIRTLILDFYQLVSIQCRRPVTMQEGGAGKTVLGFLSLDDPTLRVPTAHPLYQTLGRIRASMEEAMLRTARVVLGSLHRARSSRRLVCIVREDMQALAQSRRHNRASRSEIFPGELNLTRVSPACRALLSARCNMAADSLLHYAQAVRAHAVPVPDPASAGPANPRRRARTDVDVLLRDLV